MQQISRRCLGIFLALFALQSFSEESRAHGSPRDIDGESAVWEDFLRDLQFGDFVMLPPEESSTKPRNGEKIPQRIRIQLSKDQKSLEILDITGKDTESWKSLQISSSESTSLAPRRGVIGHIESGSIFDPVNRSLEERFTASAGFFTRRAFKNLQMNSDGRLFLRYGELKNSGSPDNPKFEPEASQQSLIEFKRAPSQ